MACILIIQRLLSRIITCINSYSQWQMVSTVLLQQNIRNMLCRKYDCRYTCPIETWPIQNELTHITEGIQTSGGGAVCNTNIDLARLDPNLFLTASGFAGHDPEGAFFIDFRQAVHHPSERPEQHPLRPG